jgi:hypothetical protein
MTEGGFFRSDNPLSLRLVDAVEATIRLRDELPFRKAPLSNSLLDNPRALLPKNYKMSGRYAFTQTVKELRFLFCQTSEHSAPVRFVHDLCLPIALPTPLSTHNRTPSALNAGQRLSLRPCSFSGALFKLRILTYFCRTRSFLTRAYPTMKKNNPHVPILIREGKGVLPKIYARYGELSLRSSKGTGTVGWGTRAWGHLIQQWGNGHSRTQLTRHVQNSDRKRASL